MKIRTAKIQKRRPKGAIRKGLPESLPTFVQKSYFMLGTKERDLLNQALSKYRPGRSEPILIGGAERLKSALQLMNVYRLRVDRRRKRPQVFLGAGSAANLQNAATYVDRAVSKEKKGDLSGAMADYDQAIKLNPNYSNAYNNRGILKQMKGDSSGATADYNQAIKLNPKNALAYCNRGITEERKGDLNGAMGDYDQAIKINPNYAIAYNNRGIIKRNKGDLNGAIADFDRAITLNAKYANAYRNRGVAKGTTTEPSQTLTVLSSLVHNGRT